MHTVIQCPRGHFYDRSMYGSCPHCENGLNEGYSAADLRQIIAEEAKKYLEESRSGRTAQSRRPVTVSRYPTGMDILTAADRTEKMHETVSVSVPVPRFSLRPAGWLVVVEGPDFGRSFTLQEGENSIGRSPEMNVPLEHDIAVSRRIHGYLTYRDQDRSFWLKPGSREKLVYLNRKMVVTEQRVKERDLIRIGDTTLMLICCCNESFSWNSIRRTGGRQ